MLIFIENIAIIQCANIASFTVNHRKEEFSFRDYCASEISAIIVPRCFLNFLDFISYSE